MNRLKSVIPTSLAGMALLLLAGGCTLTRPVADPTRFYLLAPVDLAERDDTDGNEIEAVRIGLRRVQLADYFNTAAITVRTGENSLRYSHFNRWAEGLDRGTSRLLTTVLSQQPAVDSVLLFPEASREAVVYEVELVLTACEAVETDDGGGFRFAADWKLHRSDARRVVSRGTFSREGAWERGDYAALANSISRAISELGWEIGRELERLER